MPVFTSAAFKPRAFNRHSIALAVCVALSAVGGMAQAQTVGYNIRTGDVWVDTRLGEINDYGTRYRDPFITEMGDHYGAPRAYVTELLTVRRWAPADVYYACAIAHALRRPCAEVVREYDRHPGQGWGVTAKRLGIKPGSPAFHALKRGTVATYDRWGHPVVIDRNVRVDWSSHGPGKGSHKASAKGSHHAGAHGGGKARVHASTGKPGKATSHGHGGGNGHGKGGGGNGKGKGGGNGKGH